MKLPEKLRIKIPANGISDRVVCVKNLRMITGGGLKESLDIINQHGLETVVSVTTKYGTDPSYTTKVFEDACQILRNNGVKIGSPVHELLEELRLLAIKALEVGEDELANETLQLVLAEKLRRNAY